MEDHAIVFLVAMTVVPLLFGAVWAWITRQDKHYYRYEGGRIKKIK